MFMIVWFSVIAISNVEALLASMSGISEAFTGTKLNDPVSEVDVMKYQQLVGKTMAIDEKTRFNRRICESEGCMQECGVSPPFAEGTLGLFIYDFFEREHSQEGHLGDQTDAGEVDILEAYPSP